MLTLQKQYEICGKCAKRRGGVIQTAVAQFSGICAISFHTLHADLKEKSEVAIGQRR